MQAAASRLRPIHQQNRVGDIALPLRPVDRARYFWSPSAVSSPRRNFASIELFSQDWRIVVAVGRAHITFPRLNPQVSRSHHPSDALVIDQAPAATKLAGHPSVSIAGQLVLNILNETDEFLV